MTETLSFAQALKKQQASNHTQKPKMNVTYRSLVKVPKTKPDPYQHWFSVVFFQDKIYIPTQALSPDSVYVMCTPVQVVDDTLSSLTKVLKSERRKKITRLDFNQTLTCLKRRPGWALTEATQTKWKILDQQSIWYGVSWFKERSEIEIALNEPNIKKNAYIVKLPYDAPMEQIAQVIFEDRKKYK